MDRPETALTAELNGETYAGIYSVAGSIVTVKCAGASRRTQVRGGTRPLVLAKQVLRELVREHCGTAAIDQARTRPS
jgi:hypothetical protein